MQRIDKTLPPASLARRQPADGTAFPPDARCARCQIARVEDVLRWEELTRRIVIDACRRRWSLVARFGGRLPDDAAARQRDRGGVADFAQLRLAQRAPVPGVHYEHRRLGRQLTHDPPDGLAPVEAPSRLEFAVCGPERKASSSPGSHVPYTGLSVWYAPM